MAITTVDFEYIRGLLQEHSAILLDDGKEYLAETRLEMLAHREGMRSISDLIVRLRADPGHNLRGKVVEAMTTNETLFFRDLHPFEALRKDIIPELLHRRSRDRRLNIWCAASSSGQEPYSLAMLLREHFRELGNWRVQIMASDISTEMLRRAREGRYSHLEVNRGVPASYLVKYFQRDGLDWCIDESIKRMVDFREINLIQAWPLMPSMDIVMIRNVLIYFGAEAKKQILAKVAQVLAPGGYLMLGGSETPFFSNSLFERTSTESSGAYRMK